MQQLSEMNPRTKILFFTDILCVWAYVAQVRVDELVKNFGDKIIIESRFLSIFGDTRTRIGEGWRERGGFAAFSDHVIDVAAGFDHVSINPKLWRIHQPKTSMTSHLFVKAAQLLEANGTLSDQHHADSGRTTVEELIWRIRCAFFVDARDVGALSTLLEVAEEMELPTTDINNLIADGSAMAALAADMEQKAKYQIEGSPTYLMNEGRQKLYGNVGYRVLQANVTELLEQPKQQASWC